MTTRQRIVAHGLMAAAALAVIGVMYAQLAGMWVGAHAAARTSPPDGDAVTAALTWRLPLLMAAAGFLFVLAGEGLLALWRPPAPPHAPKPTPDQEAEALLQKLLKEAEQNPATTPMPRGEHTTASAGERGA